jgi:hypothetical protein
MHTSRDYSRTGDDVAQMRTGGAGITLRKLRLLRLLVPLLLAAMVGMPSASLAHAREQVPFVAVYLTAGVGLPCGPQTICVTVNGSGFATQFGRTSITKSVVVHITATPCPGGTTRSYTAEATLTAANGDTLTMSGSGTICGGPGGIQASGSYSVTGGTGRFSGAGGTVAEFIRSAPTAPETTRFLGTISSAGS